MKSLKKVIIFLILILIIVCCLGAYAYFKTDLFKTPYQLFGKYLANEMEQVKAINIKPFDEIVSVLRSEKTESNIYYPNAKEPVALVNIAADTESNASVRVELYDEESDEAFKVYLAGSNEAVGVKIEELYSKYISLENKNLKKFAKMLELDEDTIEKIPDEIDFSKANASNNYVATIKALYTEYKEKFVSKFNTENNFTAEKNIEVTVGSDTVKANKYSLKTTTKEIMQNFNEVAKELFKDERFIQMYQDIYDINPSEKLKELEKDLSDIDEDEFIISLYVAKNRTIKAEIQTEEDSLEFFVENNSITINSIKNKKDYANIKIENNFDGTTGKLTFSLTGDDEESKVVLDVDKDENSYKIKSSMDYDGEENEIIEINIGYGSDIKIDRLTPTNAVVINDYSKDDLTSLMAEILANATSYIEENPTSPISMVFSLLNGGTSSSFDDSDDFSSFYDSDYSSFYTDDSDSIFSSDSSSITETDEEPAIITTTVENPEDMKEQIKTEISNGIQDCILKYKTASLIDAEANVLDYLTVENIQNSCNGYNIELIDGSTLKCTMQNSSNIYYAVMSLSSTDNVLSLDNLSVYTESEFESMN